MIIFQKIESAIIFIALLVTYRYLDFSWMWFVVLLLGPDVFMVGYLKSPILGAYVYNLGHSYILPFLLLGPSIYLDYNFGIMVAIIWGAHVAMDRMLGFGLKLPTGFRDTHLGRL